MDAQLSAGVDVKGERLERQKKKKHISNERTNVEKIRERKLKKDEIKQNCQKQKAVKENGNKKVLNMLKCACNQKKNNEKIAKEATVTTTKQMPERSSWSS